MNGLDFYIPDDIPPEVLAYGSELAQLGVGKAGKIGALVLKLELEPDVGKTVVKEQYSKVPLYTQRALYLEESLPSMAYMYIISPSGGILQGDRYRMDITLTNNALAHITTQGATRIYRMEKNFATQIVNVIVDDPGRVASGESFQYDICYMKAFARNQDDTPRCIDIAMLEPKKRRLSSIGILGDFEVVGSVYILTKEAYVTELRDKINLSIRKFTNISGGATIMPYRCGVLVRMLGLVSSDLRNVIHEVVAITRRLILDASFSGIRKG